MNRLTRSVTHVVGFDPERQLGLLPDIDAWLDDHRQVLDAYAADVSDHTDEHVIGAERDWRWGWSDDLVDGTDRELAAHAAASAAAGSPLLVWRTSYVMRRCRDGGEMPVWPASLRTWRWPARMAPFT